MLQKSENRIAELDRLFKWICEDMVAGRLSEARFQMLSGDYEEQMELRERIAALTKEISKQEDHVDNVDRFIRTVKKYLCLTELTPAILNDLVKAVCVHAPDKSSGHRVQDADISHNYIGILPALFLKDLITEARHDRNHAALRKHCELVLFDTPAEAWFFALFRTFYLS